MFSIWKHGVLAMALSLTVVGSASAVINTTPNRESLLLFDFEQQNLDNWTSDPDAEGNNRASRNTDKAFVAEGNASLKLDFTGLGGWKEPYFEVNLEEPVNLEDYSAISMDVFVPEDALFPETPGGWFQFNPRIAATGGTSYYGNRDLHVGWNHLVWDLQESVDHTEVNRIFFAGNTDGARPYTGAVYVDNVRAWKDKYYGLHTDETLIFGFDSASDVDLFTTAEGTTVEANTDKEFVIQGNGSFKYDMTEGQGWAENFIASEQLSAVDVPEGALALRLDLFVPADSAPTGWWQLGLVVRGTDANDQPISLFSDTIGLLTNQWNTIEIPLTDQGLRKVTGVSFRRNSDGSDVSGQWRGPFYIDNLRFANPATSTPTVKGDLNKNGRVGIEDATLALQIAVGNVTATSEQIQIGDVVGTGDGIKIPDATKILQVAVGTGTF